MKAVVAAFNQEKALVGAFSVITNLRMELFGALVQSHLCNAQCSPQQSWIQTFAKFEVVQSQNREGPYEDHLLAESGYHHIETLRLRDCETANFAKDFFQL